VVARFAELLRSRAIRHAETLGCYPNVVFAMTQARGRYMMYLADDDCVLGDALAEVVAVMEADRSVAITYAPWMLYDLVAQQAQGQFLRGAARPARRAGPVRRAARTHPAHHIFPEIYVARPR